MRGVGEVARRLLIGSGSLCHEGRSGDPRAGRRGGDRRAAPGRIRMPSTAIPITIMASRPQDTSNPPKVAPFRHFPTIVLRPSSRCGNLSVLEYARIV